jgi:WD40 repeat protein
LIFYYSYLIIYEIADQDELNATMIRLGANLASLSLTSSSGGVTGSSSLAEEPFFPKPFFTFQGHAADIIDVSWSRNHFVISASSDKTCRLWHVYKSVCLCVFHHTSIISAISFHPKDDRYFLSACLDGKLRLWSVAEKKVVFWNDLNNLNETSKNFITALSFCQSGKMIAVGTFTGKCILYHTEVGLNELFN